MRSDVKKNHVVFRVGACTYRKSKNFQMTLKIVIQPYLYDNFNNMFQNSLFIFGFISVTNWYVQLN